MDEPRRCCITVINGSQEVLELFRELLEEYGEGQYRCVLMGIEDVHHVDLIRDARPDLILIDQPFNDPNMAGWELVQKVRMARDLKETAIIFMTTNVRLMQELDAQLAALDVRTLLKPFDPDHLLLQVRRALADKPCGPKPDAESERGA